jgi:hypothetical protein
VAGVVVVLQVVSLVVFGFIAFFLCLSCFFFSSFQLLVGQVSFDQVELLVGLS